MTLSLARITDGLLRLSVRIAESGIRRFSDGGRAAFFDPRRFPWTTEIAQNWPEIRRELDGILADRRSIPNFQDVSEEQRALTDDDQWKTFVFFVFGTAIERNCQRCQETVTLLRRIPDLSNAMFSILSPGKTIPPHRGPYKGLLRYHLALKVPRAADSCSLWVDGQRRQWREGETLIFDDTLIHSVENNTTEERVVLFADFVRPLPWPLAVINRILLAWLAATPLARQPIDRFEKGLL